MEDWKPVPGYEGLYEVSNRGRVRSFNRAVRRRGGKTVMWRGRVLKLNAGTHGHLRVNLFKNAASEMVYVHQLVAKVFVPNPENQPLVRHWDDDKTNNVASNLVWGTHSDNRQDAIRNGVKYGRHNLEKTNCSNGHPYSGENLYVNPKTGGRACRTCKRNHWRVRNGKGVNDPVIRHLNTRKEK